MAKYEVLNGFCLTSGNDVLPKQVVELTDDQFLLVGARDKRLRKLGEKDKTKIVADGDRRIEVMESDPRPAVKVSKVAMKKVLGDDGKTVIEVPEDDPRPAVK